MNPDGTLKWSCGIGGVAWSSPAIGSDGTIYVGSSDGRLYAVNADGALRWSFVTGGWVDFSPAIGSDGTIYVGSSDGRLYAVNADGTLKWSYATGGGVESNPAISSDGIIYVGSDDAKLYAINPDGTLKWSYTTGGRVSTPAIGSDGTVYVGGSGNKLYAINADGSLDWSYSTGGYVNYPAIGLDGTIYVGSNDNRLYAINPDGNLKWSYDTGGWVPFSPAISGDGTIYVSSWDDNSISWTDMLYAINPDGSVKWSQTTNVGPNSPVIGSDGTVYVSAQQGRLYAFGLPPDTAPPVTTLVTSPIPNGAGWNNTDVLVSLLSTDGPDGSGAVAIRYAVDGVGHSYTGPFYLSTQGASALTYSSADASGNAEATKTATVRVDKTLPSLEVDALARYTTSATIHALSSDALSGIGNVEMRLDSGSWSRRTTLFTSAPGAHRVYARAFDLAGNKREVNAAFTVVTPTTYLGAPVAASVISHSKYYMVYGYLKPRHMAGSYPVRIYRWKKTSSGRWKSYGYVSAKAYDRYSYTKYARSIRLPYAGKWRLRAYAPSDSKHTARWSKSYDYVTVK